MFDEMNKNKLDLVLGVADDIDWDIYPVEHDDYGDTQWKWCVVFHLTLDGKSYELGSDYYREEPNDTQIYNDLLTVLKDGGMGEYVYDILKERKKL